MTKGKNIYYYYWDTVENHGVILDFHPYRGSYTDNRSTWIGLTYREVLAKYQEVFDETIMHTLNPYELDNYKGIV